MKTKSILITIIEQLAVFEEQNLAKQSLEYADFLAFLNVNQQNPSIEKREIGGKEAQWIEETYKGSDNDISILIVFIFRYAKNYIKKALKDSIIQTADEFSYLITLMTYESLTKTELIGKLVMEKTSGTEIIKRLLKQGLLTEFEDSQDKRSVRVAISPKGRMELVKILPEMDKVTKLVAGNLNIKEKNTLAYLLKKLDHFHNQIYHEKKDYSINDLLNDIH
ncbi:MarR family winged helix-turn-helix transcriptional regulator [Parasediminibacterium paludis]|uniref:MarR family winged helix-turn-helix transcriptional regulator n=1 Tax=Parasediminibacterium paludis TaxID=908966 RepID=A0ABV8PS34_9BACT